MHNDETTRCPYCGSVIVPQFCPVCGARQAKQLLDDRTAYQTALQPCGHPRFAVISDDEGTSYCHWCHLEEVAKECRAELERHKAKIVLLRRNIRRLISGLNAVRHEALAHAVCEIDSGCPDCDLLRKLASMAGNAIVINLREK